MNILHISDYQRLGLCEEKIPTPRRYRNEDNLFYESEEETPKKIAPTFSNAANAIFVLMENIYGKMGEFSETEVAASLKYLCDKFYLDVLWDSIDEPDNMNVISSFNFNTMETQLKNTIQTLKGITKTYTEKVCQQIYGDESLDKSELDRNLSLLAQYTGAKMPNDKTIKLIKE